MKTFSTAAFLLLQVIAHCNSDLTAHEPVPAPHAKTYQNMFPEPTLPVATDVPDRILLSWKTDPATSFSVTWRSLKSPAAVAEIAVATAGPQFTTTVEQVTGETSPLKTNLRTVHLHAATFTGLTPDTMYVYRVGSKRTQSLPAGTASTIEPHTVDYAWSEWFHVRTARRYQNKVEPVRFVYVGDAQNDVKSHWSRLIREAFRDAPKMTFMLHAGDLINRGNQDEEWGQWFHAGDFIFASIPQLAIPGNHEYDADAANGTGKGLSTRWKQRFEFPENGPADSRENIWFIDLQGIRMIGLDSNIDPVLQAGWLENVLKNNPNRWTIVTHHHPIHSTSRGRDNEQLRKTWQPLYDKYRVDLVLQGHDHSYGRSGPITIAGKEQNEQTGLQYVDNAAGTVYVVSVSGPKMYELKEYDQPADNPFEIRAQDTQLYQVIDVNHAELVYQAKTATGELYDQFKISKQSDGKNQFVRMLQKP